MKQHSTKLYTKTGDDGTTQLGDNTRVSKTNLRIIALGNLDELNCALGMIVAQKNLPSTIKTILNTVQKNLFCMMGEISLLKNNDKILPNHVQFIEQSIDKFSTTLKPLKTFITPGENMPSATCHLARAICRRAERHIIALHENQPINTTILIYMNRLSDLLFLTARYLAT